MISDSIVTPKRCCFAMVVVMLMQLAACMGTTPTPQPIYYYTLDYPPQTGVSPRILPVAVRIERFSVSPPYDSQRMIYADKGLHRNSYAHHQWVVQPGELVPYLIARDLLAAGGFRSVLTPDAAPEPTHIINGWIEEFMEDDRPGTWQASCCLHITLSDARNHDPAERILFQKTYREVENCRSNSPGAFADAMSIAAARISQALRGDVYQHLKETTF